MSDGNHKFLTHTIKVTIVSFRTLTAQILHILP